MVMYFLCIAVVLNAVNHVHGFVLTDDVILRQHVAKLPQYAQYGRSMVLVGGHLWDNNTEIYDTIIRMAGGKGVARVGIINAASADPLDGYQYYRNLFLKYGALETARIPIDLNHTADNAPQATIDLIYAQTGFFFGGGDQERVVKSLLGQYGEYTPALLALHQMNDAGAVIAGTSAGCSCQTANYMVEGGVSWDALTYGAFPDVEPTIAHAYPLVYLSSGGIGFMKGYVLDSHFSQRGREGRMIRLLSDTMAHGKGTARGIGVDENTALVVKHADTNMVSGTVIGASGVTVFDLSNSRVHISRYFNISDVYLTYLTHGDAIRLSDHQVTFSSSKTPMKNHENYDDVLTTDDVFYGTKSDSERKSEFVRIATSVFDARNGRTTHGTTQEGSPRFRIDMSAEGHDAIGYVERRHSFHSDITSYKNLRVAIYAD
ncbi:cyanophycinase-like [Mya arenaria]|uniref:cyanophycinase-like n=1 Tax=Mya arenaria TaxID=6604 RepID=UPI0022E4294A|nr:cyanophycinase-like [Mya arenaria]